MEDVCVDHQELSTTSFCGEGVVVTADDVSAAGSGAGGLGLGLGFGPWRTCHRTRSSVAAESSTELCPVDPPPT